MLAQQVGTWDIVVILVYLFAIAWLGWLGWRRTQTAADYLLAGRKAHPLVMAFSYGATFISTSAIVGFGGVAATYGMSLLWLVFLNIFVGIFIAFIFLGGATRRIGHRLDAHTFPELLGRRFNSKFIQVYAGLVVFLFIPLYAAAVLIGGTEFIVKAFGLEGSFNTALLVFGVIVAAYVLAGGLKAVMYTDALQGAVMVVGMLVLLGYTYYMVGGVVGGHRALGDLTAMVPDNLRAIGHQGWTSMPAFGWGGPAYNLWWVVVSTIIMGVGIGVLAQPQLAVRFMTVKGKRELRRAVIFGGLFILLIPGSAYVVGSLSNVWFMQHGRPVYGVQAGGPSSAGPIGKLKLLAERDGRWVVLIDQGRPVVMPVRDARPTGQTVVVDGQARPLLEGRSIALAQSGGKVDQIIPTYILQAMPHWFSLLFLLTMLAAAMSTLSSQFHTAGASIGRDVLETLRGRSDKGGLAGTAFVRLGVFVGILAAVLISIRFRTGSIVAQATAIFFGLCASTFLPAYVGGLFFRRITRAGAVASMLTGSIVTTFWLVFVQIKQSSALGICQWLTGRPSLLVGYPNWPVVDALFIALPASILAAVAVSLLTRPPGKDHLDRVFGRG